MQYGSSSKMVPECQLDRSNLLRYAMYIKSGDCQSPFPLTFPHLQLTVAGSDHKSEQKGNKCNGISMRASLSVLISLTSFWVAFRCHKAVKGTRLERQSRGGERLNEEVVDNDSESDSGSRGYGRSIEDNNEVVE
ncbi:hypothetical protein Tco_0033004 [Tanacetum coccineum]